MAAWFLSPSGWPTYASSDEETADLAARGYASLPEADVPAAVAAYQAAQTAPPPSSLPGYALASDVAAALATKANASSLPGKLSIADIPNPATTGGAALRAAFVAPQTVDLSVGDAALSGPPSRTVVLAGATTTRTVTFPTGSYACQVRNNTDFPQALRRSGATATLTVDSGSTIEMVA